MEYQVRDIIRDIRVTLDENQTSTPLTELGDSDALSLEDIIRSKIEDAVRTVDLSAPLWMVGPGIPFGKSIAWDGQEGIGSGYIELPTDFLRLLSFQMSDWSRAVFEAITPDSPQYALQSSRFPGLRGNPQKPVVVLVNKPVGMTLEFYSCTGGKGTHVKTANYLPQPRIMQEKIHIPHQLKDAAVYYAAYLVALATGQSDQAEKLLAVSNSLIQQ